MAPSLVVSPSFGPALQRTRTFFPRSEPYIRTFLHITDEPAYRVKVSVAGSDAVINVSEVGR